MGDKDARFWDRAARKYAASPIGDEAGFERTLARTRALIPGARAVELGCGTGTAALRLADAAGSYLATDISGGMIAIAQEKLEDARRTGFNGQLSFRQATAGILADEGARYDAVLGFNYLHLAGDLAAVLGHIRSLLVPGGLFISKTPCVGDMNPLVRLAIPLMRLVGKAPGVTTFSAASLAEAISAAGFEILENERHGSKKRDLRPFIAARAL
ncbi:class I SAM-dependent methyltransferase [Aquisalimonas lutea]|uniref:class I SAM-dependent methyltransferase n=1 Tax=Aquisalimonas lutea TaxID=1327750 RepID=UPI0025B305B7|nr:class I SAM-dependent methyltransferase [Aquisalimonas lutea]MDN3519380.1 class I SAM-dependent methyltransferase [Aquisalimonas lutea]